MTELNFKRVLAFMKNHPWLSAIAVISGKAITISVYVFYPLFLLYLYLTDYSGILRVISVPAISLIIVSVVRKIVNAPRPYEKYDITPLYNKKTKGNSFPSRHAFSVFIIAFAAGYVYWPLGTAIFVLGVLLAATRVLCGVHFIKDVLSGFISALIFGILGFVIL